MKIILGADHGGFEDKNQLKTWLEERGWTVLDVGAEAYESEDDYPDMVAAGVAAWREVKAAGEEAKMIFWCKSGAGVNIAANRQRGVYCSLGLSEEQLAAASKDDALNALALASEYQSLEEQKGLIEIFVATAGSSEARHWRRLNKVDEKGE